MYLICIFLLNNSYTRAIIKDKTMHKIYYVKQMETRHTSHPHN